LIHVRKQRASFDACQRLHAPALQDELSDVDGDGNRTHTPSYGPHFKPLTSLEKVLSLLAVLVHREKVLSLLASLVHKCKH
jgi:hypothetical protein